jgi:hypothetical protein
MWHAWVIDAPVARSDSLFTEIPFIVIIAINTLCHLSGQKSEITATKVHSLIAYEFAFTQVAIVVDLRKAERLC